jgi:hypothetical protein
MQDSQGSAWSLAPPGAILPDEREDGMVERAEDGTGTTYGLRHRETGRFLMVAYKEGDNSTNEEICRLTLEPGRFGDAVRYETPDLDDLVRTVRRDTKWWASSRTRPAWGDVDVKDCIPSAFVRASVFDSFGGDPVAVTETACAMRLPEWFEGKSHSTRQSAPAMVLKRTFGAGYEAVFDGEDPYMCVLDVSEHRAEIGMLLTNYSENTQQIVMLVDLPEDWPRDRDSGIGNRQEDLKLAVCRWQKFVTFDAPVPYAELDADLGPRP